MTEEPLNLDTEEAVDRLTGALIGDIDSPETRPPKMTVLTL